VLPFNQLEVKRKSADAGIDHPPNGTELSRRAERSGARSAPASC